MEISVRKDTQPQPPVLDIGFFYQYGTRATQMRGAFTEIFRTENLILMTPGVCKIMDTWLEELKLKTGLKNQDGSDGLEYADYNLSKVGSFDKFLNV